MNNKECVSGVIVLIVAVTFVFGIIIGFGLNNKQIQEVIYENIDQPMLLIEFDGWGENELDLSKTLFSYFVYNFGNTEIKNVNVRCEIRNTDDVLTGEYFFNIGNVASNSYKYQQSSINTLTIDTTKFLGICYLESADGEYINLYERLNTIE